MASRIQRGLSSAQGRLERVLKTANRRRFMARRLSRTRLAPERRVHESLSTRSGTQGWNMWDSYAYCPVILIAFYCRP